MSHILADTSRTLIRTLLVLVGLPAEQRGRLVLADSDFNGVFVKATACGIIVLAKYAMFLRYLP